MIPIVSAPNQPADFSEILDAIDSELFSLSLTWNSDRVQSIIATLHQTAGYSPPSPEAARLALSSTQLEELLGTLKEPIVGRVGDPGSYPVDRTTPLGNPFPMRSEEQRDLVCEAFRKLLWELHKSKFSASPRALAQTIASEFGLTVAANYNPTASQIWAMVAYLLSPEGRKRSLGCHCAPKRCHAHTIAKYIRYLLNEDSHLP